jgi:fatty acid/phospholipid biosynthesis enzyme
VVKCHGGADAREFGRSVGLAVDLAASDLMSQIERNMTRLGADFPVAEGDPA